MICATHLRALECGGHDLIAAMAPDDRTTLEAAAQALPYAHGLLWRATRDGTEITLFGTYHLPHAKTEAHFAALLPRAEASDFSYFEMAAPDITAFKRAAGAQPDLLFLTEGPTLPDLLGDSDWAVLQQRMSQRGVPGFMAAKMKPVFAILTLSFSPCQMAAQKDGKLGIDHRLALALEAQGADTRSIEDWRTTLTLLDTMGNDQAVGLLRMTLDQPDDSDDMSATAERAYLRGEAALVWEYSRWRAEEMSGPAGRAAFAALEDELLTRRNAAWMERLDKTAPGHSLFIAVGAAHLPGQQGLLKQLELRGYAIEPLPITE